MAAVRMEISQTVSGGKFVGRGDREITISTPIDDLVTDYGDEAPRAVLDGVDRTPLRGSDVDALIENLRTIRRVL